MITSKQNSLVKEIRSLSNKKFRDSLGVYLVEGIKMVKEAVLSGQEIKYVLTTEKNFEKVVEFYQSAEVISDQLSEYISQEVTPQGVFAVLSAPKLSIKSPVGNSLFLDQVSDPSNVGAIIRTAASAGFNDVYLFNSADPYSPKAVRASMSGVYKVRIYSGERESLINAINLPFVVADMDGVDVKEFKCASPICLVIGNEGRGVSQEMRDLAEYTLSLKMDNGMESLNASVSASILMYKLAGKV